MERPLVLRVEIESLGEELQRLLAERVPGALPSAVAGPPAVDDSAVREREAAVAAAELDLERRRDRLTEEAERVDALSRRLAEREAAVETGGVPTASQKLRLERRDQELDARMLELNEREERLDVREAEFEADVELREDRMEERRADLEELEQRLKRREAELLVYVAQLQEEFVRRDGGRWATAGASITH